MVSIQPLLRYPQTREALQRAVRAVEALEEMRDDYYNASEEENR